MHYDKINMMLPTRGRSSGLLDQHFQSGLAYTRDFRKICYTVLVDGDDCDTCEYFKAKNFPFDIQVIEQCPQEKPHLANFYNLMYERTEFQERSTLVSMIGDDMQWRTEGYEKSILDAVNQRTGIAVACCDDGFHHSHKRFVNMFTSRDIVDATGKPFMCPLFPADYIDDMWWMIAEEIGATVWLDAVTLYHDHASRRPQADRDLTCQRLRQVAGESRRNIGAMYPWVSACVKSIKESGLCVK